MLKIHAKQEFHPKLSIKNSTFASKYSHRELKMELNSLISECTAYDFKLMLEENRPKSWLKSVSAFANSLGGSLFFGLDNDGVVRGFDNMQLVCETISSKVREYMDPLPEVEMKPVFKSTLTQFQTIIFASFDMPVVGDNFGDVSETKLIERQKKKILNLVNESPTITGKQMSEMLSVSQRTIERDLSAMKKNDILKHEGKDNDGVWIIYR